MLAVCGRVAGVAVKGPLLWSLALQLANLMAYGAAALGAPQGKGVAVPSEAWARSSYGIFPPHTHILTVKAGHKAGPGLEWDK